MQRRKRRYDPAYPTVCPVCMDEEVGEGEWDREGFEHELCSRHEKDAAAWEDEHAVDLEREVFGR